MVDLIFSYLEMIDDHLWSFIGFPMIMVFGILLSMQGRFCQIRQFPAAMRNFFNLFLQKPTTAKGVHPIKAFFACVGGCIGIGNVVGVCTAVQIGGPGAVFWVWVAAIAGMILKYSEIFVGMRHRVARPDGGHDGGPMYFLKGAFKNKWVPGVVCFLLCLYGVELFQFRVMTASISSNFGANHLVVTLICLWLVVVIGPGGIGLVGTICSWVIPVFFVLYYAMGFWVFYQNYEMIPQVLSDIFVYAFTPYAEIGGVTGGLIMTISQGIRRGCYSSDVGVGYASVIHSESSSISPERQAALAIVDIFLDAFLICTMSMMIVLVTGRWLEPIDASQIVQIALSQYFPYMHIFMPVFLVLLGYSTVIAFFVVGLKCAEYMGGEKGRKIFYVYAIISLFCFSYVDTKQALVAMSIIQLLLVVINLIGIYRLRKEINFDFATSVEAESKAIADSNSQASN